MPKPTSASIEAMKVQVVADIATINGALLADRTCTQQEAEAMASIETFVNVALRVMARTNPLKIKDAMVATEIHARMSGAKVFE